MKRRTGVKEEIFSSLSLIKEKLCRLCHVIYFSFVELRVLTLLKYLIFKKLKIIMSYFKGNQPLPLLL